MTVLWCTSNYFCTTLLDLIPLYHYVFHFSPLYRTPHIHSEVTSAALLYFILLLLSQLYSLPFPFLWPLLLQHGDRVRAQESHYRHGYKGVLPLPAVRAIVILHSPSLSFTIPSLSLPSPSVCLPWDSCFSLPCHIRSICKGHGRVIDVADYVLSPSEKAPYLKHLMVQAVSGVMTRV